MKKFVLIFLILPLIYGCSTIGSTSRPSDSTMNFEKNDENEYDIIVLDTQYDFYLRSIAQPENFYSEQYYKTNNGFFVAEWNLRYNQPDRYDPNFYSTYIDYNPQTEYGLHFEYKLYNFFKFIEWKYRIRL